MKHCTFHKIHYSLCTFHKHYSLCTGTGYTEHHALFTNNIRNALFTINIHHALAQDALYTMHFSQTLFTMHLHRIHCTPCTFHKHYSPYTFTRYTSRATTGSKKNHCIYRYIQFCRINVSRNTHGLTQCRITKHFALITPASSNVTGKKKK